MKARWVYLLVGLVLGSNQWVLNTAYGQGYVTFAPQPGGQVTDCETGQAPVGAFNVQLYFAPDGTTDRAQFAKIGAPTALSANGTYNGGSRMLPVAAPGDAAMLYAAAWETAFGASYEQASQVNGARVGYSAIVRRLTGPVSAPTSGNLPDFQVCAVPEPSAWVLGLVGLGVLAVKARRGP